ncbi:hypothetical protein ILYODFUR_031213 [Ilyodon furcidens]|uniref:Reverse transcriptase domain-containing protein n=1 Tax=Ilyodon furcidens TaxID=33524 RepID=A0ABV0TCH6_9TELE
MFNFQKANDPMPIVYNPTLHNLPTNPYSALDGSHLFCLCNIIFLKESDLNNETFQNLKNKSYAASTAQSLLGSDYKSLPQSASEAFGDLSINQGGFCCCISVIKSYPKSHLSLVFTCQIVSSFNLTLPICSTAQNLMRSSSVLQTGNQDSRETYFKSYLGSLEYGVPQSPGFGPIFSALFASLIYNLSRWFIDHLSLLC